MYEREQMPSCNHLCYVHSHLFKIDIYIYVCNIHIYNDCICIEIILMIPKKFNSGYCSWITEWGRGMEKGRVTSRSDSHFLSPPFFVLFQCYTGICIILLKNFFNRRKKKPTDLTVTLKLSSKERCWLINLRTC